MRDIDKISGKVEKRRDQLSELFTKDTENYELWDGKEQIFDSHKMAVNITGTEMVAKALSVQESLNRSELDIDVLPPEPLPNPGAVTQANQEERMYYYGFEKADERLLTTGNAALLPSCSWQATVLGRIVVRILLFICPFTGELVFDYLPLYPSLFTFEFDRRGLAWGAYETFRSAESIYEEYKVEVKDDGKGVSVTDYWDRDHNVRYLTGDKTQLGKVWKHKLGEVPIIFQPVTRIPRAIDSNGIKVTTWGESIFDHAKTQFRKLNEMRSIAATHAHLIAKAPLDVTYEGDTPNLEGEHLDFYPGALLKHPSSMKIQSMNIADIPPSLGLMMGDLKQGIDNVTYAELSPDPSGHSGSALRILGQKQLDVETPRFNALNMLYTRICKMVKRQIIAQDLTIPVQTVVDKNYQTYEIKPDLLENDFFVKAQLIRKDVYDEEAQLQKAQMLMQLRLKSRSKVMEQELNYQDVPAMITEIDMEDFEAAVPELKLLHLIRDYRKRGMEEEARLGEEQLALLVINKQQAIQGMIGGQEAQPPGGMTPPVTPPAQPSPQMGGA